MTSTTESHYVAVFLPVLGSSFLAPAVTNIHEQHFWCQWHVECWILSTMHVKENRVL